MARTRAGSGDASRKPEARSKTNRPKAKKPKTAKAAKAAPPVSGRTPVEPDPTLEAEVTGPPSGPLVLVVDDYQDAREMCAEFLVYSGFRVCQAKNGHEALERAFKFLPHAILMDLSLPGMDGWEATRRLKADERTREIPVIALTGHALAGHSEGAKRAGCDSFITKPCLPDAMVAEVRRMLDLAKSKGRRS